MNTIISDKLKAAFAANKGAAPGAYSKAVEACDEAWRAVDGAMMSPFKTLQAEAILDYRLAYDAKIKAFYAAR